MTEDNKVTELLFIPACLIMGILSSQKELDETLIKTLTDNFGPFDVLADPVIFDFTDYYEKEMGFPIWRMFLVFENLVPPENLAKYKLLTIEIEERFKVDSKRKVNLDPGLLTTANIILATTKNRSHRIPLEKGIYGELTLLYTKGCYQEFEWTYPDYKSAKFKALFEKLRSKYLKQLKEKNLI
ncbi:MAG: DUF4416 family protein [Sphaerochaetaceae bacterium]